MIFLLECIGPQLAGEPKAVDTVPLVWPSAPVLMELHEMKVSWFTGDNTKQPEMSRGACLMLLPSPAWTCVCV